MHGRNHLLAVIVTRTDEIIRLFETGPLPKMITTSPDGSRIAVTHWGNNTVGVLGISSDDQYLFMTAQGRSNGGGNAVDIFRFTRKKHQSIYEKIHCHNCTACGFRVVCCYVHPGTYVL